MFLSGHVGVSSLLTPSKDYDMLLEWVGLILDVHFTRLTLDNQSWQLLLALQSKVLAQVTLQVHCMKSDASNYFSGNLL